MIGYALERTRARAPSANPGTSAVWHQTVWILVRQAKPEDPRPFAELLSQAVSGPSRLVHCIGNSSAHTDSDSLDTDAFRDAPRPRWTRLSRQAGVPRAEMPTRKPHSDRVRDASLRRWCRDGSGRLGCKGALLTDDDDVT